MSNSFIEQKSDFTNEYTDERFVKFEILFEFQKNDSKIEYQLLLNTSLIIYAIFRRFLKNN